MVRVPVVALPDKLKIVSLPSLTVMLEVFSLPLMVQLPVPTLVTDLAISLPENVASALL